MIDRIHADLSADWSLPQLTSEAGLGETLFRREFKQTTGLTPVRFIRQARLHAAAQMIEQGTYTLAAIAEQLNFSSPFHLSTAFKHQFGIRPSRLASS
jgi:AraC family transcriptional regulator